MGCGTSAYAVDIDSLRRIFGSDDSSLLQAIEKQQGELMREVDEEFEDRIREGLPTQREALSQIIAGKIDGPEGSAFLYGYALEVLCKHLGRDLGGEDLIEFVEDLELSTALIESGSPIPIPEPDGAPGIGFLTAGQVREEHELFGGQDLSHEEEAITEAREAFLALLTRARELGLGLVTFTY